MCALLYTGRRCGMTGPLAYATQGTCGFIQSTEFVTGLVYWSEGNLSPEQLWAGLTAGKLIDGSYLVISFDSDRVRIWSDPLGTVPCYYGYKGGALAAGTNAIEVAGFIQDRLDEDARWIFALFDYVPWPRTLFGHVFRCPPGSLVEINLQTGEARTRRYFHLPQAVAERAATLRREQPHLPAIIHDVWLASLRKILSSLSPSERVGVSLSGGLDSRYLACAMREVGYRFLAYTYSSATDASDTVLARRVARSLSVPWQHFTVSYDPSELARFVARYGGMEPPAMGFLPKLAEQLRAQVDVVLVAAGGDIVWGSHSSLKQVAKASRAYWAWKKRCTSSRAAWAAACELGDVSWAEAAPRWRKHVDDVAQSFDEAVADWQVGPILGERFWSMLYRQPSYTWNSNLVYADAGIKVLCPTLTLDSVLTGLALPASAAWEGRAYARSAAAFYPEVAHIPLTRSRLTPHGTHYWAELATLLLAFKRLMRSDWYVPWVSVNDWLPVWQGVVYDTLAPSMDGGPIPPVVKARLEVFDYLASVLSAGP